MLPNARRVRDGTRQCNFGFFRAVKRPQGFGETAAELDWLAEAEKEHSGWMPCLKVEPRLDAPRALPEFEDLIKRVGLYSNKTEIFGKIG